jgi:Domain of unknown function (DUF427)
MPQSNMCARSHRPRRPANPEPEPHGASPRADRSPLYESGFAPRWYVRPEDIDESPLEPVAGQTFCPYTGLASYYDIGDRGRAAWCYTNAWPDKIDVYLDGTQLHLEPGQNVVSHGIDRGLDPNEILRGHS